MITRIGYSQLKSLPVKQPCYVATTGNISNLLSGAPDLVDGVSLLVGSRILVKDQSVNSENGIYLVVSVGTGSDGSWERSIDGSIDDDFLQGLQVYVNEGTLNGGKTFVLETPNPIQLNTSGLTFSLYSSGGSGTGTSGTSGVSGTSGTSGFSGVDGSNSTRWIFNGATMPSNPGSTYFLTDFPALSGVSGLSIHKDDINLIDFNSWLQSLLLFDNDLGYIKISEVNNSSSYAIYTLSSGVDNVSYFDLTVTFVSGSNSLLVTGNQYSISWVANGQSGTSGTSGSAGTSGTSGQNGTSGTSGTSGTGFNSILNPSNNAILTSDGSSNTAYAQSNLTFDGNVLNVTGDVIVSGDLTINGTATYINTQNLSVEDNVITLNATYSGPYNVFDSGIEVNLGGGTYASLIWDSSESLWAVGFSGSESTIITEAGVGLTKSGSNLSIDFNSVTGTGLTQNGFVIGIDTIGFASTLAGAGLSANGGTLSVNVGNGLEIVSDTVYLGGTLSQLTVIEADGNDFTIGNFDNLSFTGSNIDIELDPATGLFLLDSNQIDLYGENLTIITTDDIDINTSTLLSLSFATSSVVDISGASAGLVYAGDYSAGFLDNSLVTKKYVDSVSSLINVDNGIQELSPGVIGLGGTLSQNTTINSENNNLTLQNFNILTLTGSLVDIQLDNGLFLVDAGSGGSVDLYGGDVTIYATGSFDVISTNEFTISAGTASVTTSNLEGLVYTTDYSTTFVNNSLITKQYVDTGTSSIWSYINGLSANTSGTSGTSGESGTSGQSGTSGTSGQSGTSGTSGTGFNGSGTTNYVPRWLSSNNLSSTSSIWDNGTNVGIGITTSTFAKLHVNNTGVSYSLLVDDSTYPDSTPFVIDASGSIGIGTMSTASSKVTIVGTSSVLNVVGSVTNSTIFEVNGVSGQLFSINDSLTGSLFSVNDISGLPILEVFSDSTTIIGDFVAPSLYTTKKTDVGTSSTDIYSFATASYDGSFVDYTIKNGVNSRSGNLMATWNGSSIQYTESSTLDIGTTSGFTFSFAISGTYGVLRGQASTNGWTVKTIIRSI